MGAVIPARTNRKGFQCTTGHPFGSAMSCIYACVMAEIAYFMYLCLLYKGLRSNCWQIGHKQWGNYAGAETGVAMAADVALL